MKYYFDTSIWFDYFENRSDKFRPLGEWAFALLAQIRERKDVLLISDVVLQEFAVKFTELQIKDLLKPFVSVLVEIAATDKQNIEAGIIARIRKLPRADALHAVLARDNDAILVSRDNHFGILCDIAQVRKPEDLI